ncbi:MAG: helix-turn-helix domain-containing protein [Thermosynechococcaceae cyanobacterium MS004]|nr:helix-turn-helix domain-containing protein [Thermosynechococcaceae cyanobacterium MS004]
MRFPPSEADSIRQLKAQGWSYCKLSRRFNASTATLFRVVRRRGLYGVDLSDYV